MKQEYLIVVVVVVLGFSAFLLFTHQETPSGDAIRPRELFDVSTSTGPVFSSSPAPAPATRFAQDPHAPARYVSDTLPFSFAIPAGFTTGDYKTSVPGGSAVVLISDSGHGMLLFVIPEGVHSAPPDPAYVDAIWPGRSVQDATSVALPGGVTGLRFSSDSRTWNGEAEEIWFVHGGYRYELSTYRGDADLLDFIANSWEWR